MNDKSVLSLFYKYLDKIKKETGAEDVRLWLEDGGLVFQLDWSDDYHMRWFIRGVDFDHISLDHNIAEAVHAHKYRIIG